VCRPPGLQAAGDKPQQRIARVVARSMPSSLHKKRY